MVSDALVYFTEPRGEFTLVISATQAVPADALDARPKALTMLRAQRDQGIRSKEAIAATVAETLLSRNEVYEMWVGMQSNS
jgi:16S rRNA C1402 (ribose-2'-O) methylase RsmI